MGRTFIRGEFMVIGWWISMIVGLKASTMGIEVNFPTKTPMVERKMIKRTQNVFLCLFDHFLALWGLFLFKFYPYIKLGNHKLLLKGFVCTIRARKWSKEHKIYCVTLIIILQTGRYFTTLNPKRVALGCTSTENKFWIP